MKRELELERRLRSLHTLGEAVGAMKSLSAHHFRETRSAVAPARIYREGVDHEAFMQPGEVYEVRIWLQATSNWFAPGHRMRLDISSSSFPRWDRNLNTGGRNYDETQWAVAHNTVHHAPGRASCVVLPVVE